MLNPFFIETVNWVHKELSSLYAVKHSIEILDFISIKNEPSENNRLGQFLIWEKSSDETHVRLEFHPEIYKNFIEASPIQKLSDQNLNAFLVLSEEISHFVFFLERLSQKQNISTIEMELQGELDKFFLASKILFHQNENNSHAVPLARKLFDQSLIYQKNEHEKYSLVNNLAAKLIYFMIKEKGDRWSPHQCKEFNYYLKIFYTYSWNEKKCFIKSIENLREQIIRDKKVA